MKKIYSTLTIAAALLLASCNMDLQPIGSLDNDNAIESTADLKKARNGIYESLRSVTTGSFIYCTDIQMDQFMGLTINGNQLGNFAHGNIYSNTSEIESAWASMYSCIADCNYVLGAADKLKDEAELTDEDILEIDRYIGETKFARAYYYYYLLDHWCDVPNIAAYNNPASGVPLVTEFNPTGDITTYPGRSTMAEVFELIDSDLADAYTELKAYEEATAYQITPMDYYVNSFVVRALQSRIAFMRSDWEKTVELCNEIINSGIYTLATTRNYSQMWTDDYSDEIIFRPYSSNTELGIGSTGEPYVSVSQQSVWYIPTFENLEMYEENDCRFDAFFTVYNAIKANGTNYAAYVFNKYPGNTALYQGSPNIMNMGKPFRLSETYLMLAEASFEMNDATTANKALNTLRKNRISMMLGSPTYSGAELENQIRGERTKELIGEGFRMSDLRRWGLGFTRDSSYPINSSIEDLFVTIDTQVQYIPNDYRYLWPIPSGEMQNNPQIRNQQNPGY